MNYDSMSDRELDALFAERVLGCKVVLGRESYMGGPDCGCDPNIHGKWSEREMGHLPFLPKFTHSLDAAWEGVEKLRSERGYEFNVWWNTEGEDRGVGYSPKEMRELGSTSGECRVYVEGWTDDGESAFGELGNNELAVADHPARALVISCLKAVEAK